MINIIIGGTHGLGREIALQLQQAGEETFVTGRSHDKTKHGDGMRVNLAEADDAQALATRICTLGARAINFYWVAGSGYKGDFADQDSPDLMAAANFGNVLPAAQVAFKRMLAQDEVGHFVVISSTTGFKPRPDEATYAGTKFAQVGFASSLGLESQRLGGHVKVALIEPGGMRTPFWDGNRPGNFDDFLDPAQVATRIIEGVNGQQDTFLEAPIQREDS